MLVSTSAELGVTVSVPSHDDSMSWSLVGAILDGRGGGVVPRRVRNCASEAGFR